MLQDHLKNMQSVTEEFRDKLRQSQGDSKLKVVVENVKHVLKTEEDVYNYFVRFGAIESIVDEQGEDLDDAIPRGCHICVFFDSTEAVDRVLKFKHEVVEVRGRGGRHREEEYFHSDRREDLYRHYSMAEADKGVEDNIERNNLNKSN